MHTFNLAVDDKFAKLKSLSNVPIKDNHKVASEQDVCKIYNLLKIKCKNLSDFLFTKYNTLKNYHTSNYC